MKGGGRRGGRRMFQDKCAKLQLLWRSVSQECKAASVAESLTSAAHRHGSIMLLIDDAFNDAAQALFGTTERAMRLQKSCHVTPVVFIFQPKSTIANLMCANQWEFVPGRLLHSLCRLLCWVMWVVQCSPIKRIYKFLTCNGRQNFHEIRESPCVHTQPTSMSTMLLVLMSWHMAECTVDLFKLAIGLKGTLNSIK